ncbi:MAG TPA: hypothetical protein VM265_04995 [Sphingomicrobium sp.]|nr:hypothetical protein [Sphingomicrobium sp.]
MKFIIMIALLLVLAVAALMLLRPSGPRVTEIERRREIDDEDRR